MSSSPRRSAEGSSPPPSSATRSRFTVASVARSNVAARSPRTARSRAASGRPKPPIISTASKSSASASARHRASTTSACRSRAACRSREKKLRETPNDRAISATGSPDAIRASATRQPPACSTSVSTRRRTGRPLICAPLLLRLGSRCLPLLLLRVGQLLQPRGPGHAPTPIDDPGPLERAVHALNRRAKHQQARIVQLVDEVTEALRPAPSLLRDLHEPIQQLDRVPRLIEVQPVSSHVDHALRGIEPYPTLLPLLAFLACHPLHNRLGLRDRHR